MIMMTMVMVRTVVVRMVRTVAMVIMVMVAVRLTCLARGKVGRVVLHGNAWRVVPTLIVTWAVVI